MERTNNVLTEAGKRSEVFLRYSPASCIGALALLEKNALSCGILGTS
jgi:hypothetical protein